MNVDLAQFHQTFFEGSFEGLEAMEGGLLNLNAGEPDLDVINAIFRAAHSIKGGSATFGFSSVANFTHTLETLLDEMRAGKREVTREAVDLLLQSVDCLRAMLAATQSGAAIEQGKVDALHGQLEELLKGGQVTASASATATPAAASGGAGWEIMFRPHPNMLRTGNDPVRMFRELAQLGDLAVTAYASGLPEFVALDPEASYLGWRLQLKGDIVHSQVAEIFDWVTDHDQKTGTSGRHHRGHRHAGQRVVTNLQFEDMVTQVISHINQRIDSLGVLVKVLNSSVRTKQAGYGDDIACDWLPHLQQLLGEARTAFERSERKAVAQTNLAVGHIELL